MDEDIFQTNLNTVKEQVLDEEKLVTYVTLSKDLCIHINDSKQLLMKFVENTRKKQPSVELNVCYVVSGLTEDNKGRTTVTLEKDIQDLRNSLKLVFYEHIYSVNKGSPAVDRVAYLAVNKFDDFLLCTGLIKSHFCVKRSTEEIGSLKSNSQVVLQVEQKPTTSGQKKVKEEIKSIPNGHNDTKNVAKVQESKSEPNIKTEVPSPKKDASFGSKQKVDNKKNGVKSQRGIAGFFNKSNSAPNKIISKDISEVKKDVPIKKEKDPVNVVEEEQMDVDIEDAGEKEDTTTKETKPDVKKEPKNKSLSQIKKATEDVEEKQDIKKKEKADIKKESVNGKSKKKSPSQIKKTAKVDKKRKRVLQVSDSEDDDPFADEPEIKPESDDEIPPTPTVNTVKITSGIINPKKRRKIVDKTFTDEEGYILTKKVEVYESCSDNEVEVTKENIQAPPIKKVKQETSPKDKKTSPKKNSKKKVSPPQKGKQANIMNFFKKV